MKLNPAEKPVSTRQIYQALQEQLHAVAAASGWLDTPVAVSCYTLSTEEALGTPEDNDYPLQKGRERMVEATLHGFRGQAFTDQFTAASYTVRELLELPLQTNAQRAHFVAAFNAVWRAAGKCGGTVHCRNEDLRRCALELPQAIPAEERILLVGLQPRLLEMLASRQPVRAVDMDTANIGKKFGPVTVEAADQWEKIAAESDRILATGSTLVNGTITGLLNSGKPVLFFGVTIAGPGAALGLDTWCPFGT